MATGKRIPRRADIDPALIGEDWANCMLVSLDPVLDHSTFISVGENLLPEPGKDLTGQPISECPRETLVGAILPHLARVASSGNGLTTEGATVVHHRVKILYRSILLPLSNDGTKVDSVLGAANFRKVRWWESVELHTQVCFRTRRDALRQSHGI